MDSTMEPHVVAIGHRCPGLGVSARTGATVTLDRFRGQSVVLGLFGAFRPAERELEAIRAELRGLGAAIVLVSNAGVWCFGPDDDVELWAASGDLEAGVLDALRAAWGAREREGSALFVIDGDRVVRFLRRDLADGLATLSAALAEAGRALLRSPRAAGGMTRRQWLNACLVAG